MDSSWLNGLDFQWLRDSGRGSNTFLQAFQIGAQMKERALQTQYRQQQAQAHWESLEMRYKIESSKLMAQENIARGHAELGQVLSEIAHTNSWTDPASKARFWDTASKYPQLMASPTFKELTQQFELADSAALRSKLLDTTITGREDLERTRQLNRLGSINARFDRMVDMKLDDEQRKIAMEELLQEHRLERDRTKASSGGQERFDLNKSDEIAFRAELASLQTAFNQGVLEADEFTKKRDAVITKYKAKARTPQQPTGTNAPPVLRLQPDGTFK